MISYIDRVNLSSSIDEFLYSLAINFSLGAIKSFKVIEVGYEDLNVKLETDSGVYLAKIFSKNRITSEVNRFVKVVESALAAGVSHPQMFKNKNGGLLYSDAGVSAVVMLYVNGKTFYDMGRAPNDSELMQIAKEAINSYKVSP